MDLAFCQAQVDFNKELITQLQAIFLKLASNPRATYSINTGQTTESVTKDNAAQWRAVLNGALLDLSYWCQMCDEINGITTATYMRPGY
jgi:hypothetical protein